MYTVITGAIQVDADICNRTQVEAPSVGIHIGPGLHVVIPVDWLVRCVAGEQIPGCTFHRVNDNGTMEVSDKARINSAIPANVVGVNATSYTNFRNKVTAGTAVP